MTPAKNILVVDDDADDLQLTVRTLNQRAAATAVAAAHDGAQALDFLHRRGEFKKRPPGNPDLILLDLNMPKVDGFEVLRAVKADPVLRNIPIVVFTSSSRESDVSQGYQLGANAYVVKPMDYSQYAEVIQHICAFWFAHNQPPPVNSFASAA